MEQMGQFWSKDIVTNSVSSVTCLNKNDQSARTNHIGPDQWPLVLFSFIHTSPQYSKLIYDKWKEFFLLSAVNYCLSLYCRSLATLLEPGSFMNKNLTMMMMMRLSQILSLSKVNFYVFVSFIPYFHLLVFGILVTLVAWFSFRFFSVLPILPCKM